MFKLVIQDDEGKTTVVPLIRDEITIGRKEGNTIRLTERNVSRRHARILRNNGEVQIEDLGSYNGIRVNNARIAERVSLRVSDQVQIGDYKLYLKAEGVEQVDEARTMPIERIDQNTAPTDVHAAVPPPTQPLPVAVPHTPVPGSMVGSPNRTLVAVADTDPQGRPIASAATVAAMMAPVGNGKLVVLSSNFAGKEFDLSRPQMIIGRTDDNDIVINHRSISRNHAKIVREPETQRYTISDLQSSNGVRVNGQDYSKVELRRGDVVDLGHVRLRFVEPGEDFVFSRDAVITDVPEGSSKKGLLVAVIFAALVLGAVVIYLVTRTKETPSGGQAGNGSTGQNTALIDGGGSNAIVAVATPDAAPVVEPGSGSDPAPTGDDEKSRLRAECKAFIVDKKWVDLRNCSAQLEKLDKEAAKDLRERAEMETKVEAIVRDLDDAIRDGNTKLAKQKMDAIKSTSAYYKDAKASYEKFEKAEVDSLVADLKGLNSGNCKDFNKRLNQEEAAKGRHITDAARSRVKCVVVATNPNPNPNPDKGSNTTTPVKPACKFDDLKAAGDSAHSSGAYQQALAAYEDALRCQFNADVLKKGYMAACKAHNLPKAKQLFAKIPAADQNYLSQICLKEGLDPH